MTGAHVIGSAIERETAECTGVMASWCPNCGDCHCPKADNGERCGVTDACPLHGYHSRHAETRCAGGCGTVVNLTGERCSSCEITQLRRELDAARAELDASKAVVTEYLDADAALDIAHETRRGLFDVGASPDEMSEADRAIMSATTRLRLARRALRKLRGGAS